MDEFLHHCDPPKLEIFPFIVIGMNMNQSERVVGARRAQQWCQNHHNIPNFEVDADDVSAVDNAKNASNLLELHSTEMLIAVCWSTMSPIGIRSSSLIQKWMSFLIIAIHPTQKYSPS
ncbi:ras-related protein Rab7-like [Symsagittifera roscoffensis]|uniref:ras-related protein Rab7-like n=1 Tax=Symsagittifera roscoffensis TaxID=84072 RepID=UPI00307C3C76